MRLYYNLPVPPGARKIEEVGVLPIDTPSGDRGIRTPDLCHDRPPVVHSSMSSLFRVSIVDIT